MRLRHVLARAATVVCAVPLALGLATASPAAAEEIEVPGCYGAAVVVCDPAVEIVLPVGTEPFSTTIPVCAGTCIDVPVNAYTVRTNEDPHVCVKTEDRNGNQSRTCRPIGELGGVPSVEPCSSGRVGAVIRDGNGNTIYSNCRTLNIPAYSVEGCDPYWGETGFRIVDENGNTVVNGCFVLGGLPYVEACSRPYFGVYVYDGNGNTIYGRCQRPIGTISVEELCRDAWSTVSRTLEPWAQIAELSCG